MSGLLAACFPADGRNPSGSHAIDVAAAAAAAGGGLAGVAGAALVGSLNAGPMGVAGSVQLHASDDSGPPDHSMAAVAALLRQAGVRAPTVYGDSTMMPAGGTGYPGSEADVSVHGRSRKASAIDRIEAVRRELTKANINVGDTDNISCCELLGEGTYGKVYKGLWKGSVVAVKTIVLPALMSGAEKREKMAIMEAAISSALSHPNIVQTYTYSIRQLRDTSAAASRLVMGIPHAGGFDNSEGNGGPGGVHSFEVQLVLEYCDRGSLRDALDRGAFRGAFAPHSTSTASDASGSSHGRAGTGAAAAAGSGAGGDGTVGPASFSGPLSSSSGAADVNYRAVLDTALDVATAMVHLHGRNVLHADLKARNIMLKSNGAEGRGVSAKVADFGLSVKMDHMETHLSNTFQGTLSHMSPELLMKGYLSKASDVYAFGILLWELYTGGHPFRTVPKALLGHQITKLHKRPEFPTGTPAGFMALAARCWDPKPSRRPTMDEVLAELKYLRRDEPAATPPLAAYELPFASAVDSHGNALPSGASGTATAGVRGGGGGAIAAMERSVYIEHSYSTLHEGTFEGCDGTSGPSQGGDRACSSGSGDDSSSGGSRGGSPDGRHASQAARCPLHHGSH